jgi:hypothetical protein
MASRRTIARHLAALAALLLGATAAFAEAPLALRKATVGAATSWFAPDVSPEEVRWPAPPTDGMKNAPIFGYAHRWKPGQPIPNAERVQMPLYRNFDSDDPKWWDQQLDELLFTRPPLIFLIGRGCTKPEDRNSFVGPGHMCPYKLRMMVDAVRRSAAEDAARFALFVDTGGTFALRRAMTRNGPERLEEARSNDRDPNTRFDLSDRPDSSGRTALWYFWDATVRPWFDTVPKEMWYRIDDAGTKKPVIAFWGITHRFTGHRGNTTKLLADLKAKFVERYGVEPFFILSTAWITGDPSLAERTDLVGGVHSWFNTRFGEPKGGAAISRWNGDKWQIEGVPNGISSLTEWNGRLWGVTIPGFSCGQGCNIGPVPRNGGAAFQAVLEANKKASINIIEGFNGPYEGTASFRSVARDWREPNQYMGLLRRMNDPRSRATRLQAESADDLAAAAAPQTSDLAFSRNFDIRKLASDREAGAWELQAAAEGDGFAYRQLYFDAGTYRFILRASARAKNPVAKLLVNGSLAAQKNIPLVRDNTPVITAITTLKLTQGFHDIRVVIANGEASFDWLVINRTPD